MLGGLDYKSIAVRVRQALAAGIAYAAKGDIVIGTGVGTVAIKSAPSNGKIRMADSNQTDGWLDVAALRGLIGGLTLSNNVGDATNDIDIAAGGASSSTFDYYMSLAAALTKQLDAVWAVGTNAGMRASGAAIANGTYHIFLIARPDTGVVDIAADTSVTGANIAANTAAAYTQKRRIGSILREGAAIVGFVQDGELFQRKATILDVNATNPGTSAVSRTLSVPVGINVRAMVNAGLIAATSGAGTAFYLSDLAVNDEAASRLTAPGANVVAETAIDIMAGPFFVRTNTSAQIRSRASNSGAADIFRIVTLGWMDTRGRND